MLPTLASAQALTPDSVFQVTVSEDNAYVALASRRRVIVTAVAARGASLVSAIDRMQHTRLLLNDDSVAPGAVAVSLPPTAGGGGLPRGGLALRYEPPAPVLSLSDCLKRSGVSQPMPLGISAAGSDLVGAVATGRSAWASIVATATEATRLHCDAILDPSRTPTAAELLAVLSNASGGGKGAEATSRAPPAVVQESGAKRKRPEAATAAVPSAEFAAAATLPRSVAICALQRCVSALRAPRTDAAGGSGGLEVAPVLRALLANRAVSLVSSPELIPALMAVAARNGRASSAGRGKSSAGGRRLGAKAQSDGATPHKDVSSDAITALELVCEVLAECSDTPEATLVDVFVRVRFSWTMWICSVWLLPCCTPGTPSH